MGEENRGRCGATTLLDVERSNIAGAIVNRKPIRNLIDYVKTDEGKERSRLHESGVLRHQIAERYIDPARIWSR